MSFLPWTWAASFTAFAAAAAVLSIVLIIPAAAVGVKDRAIDNSRLDWSQIRPEASKDDAGFVLPHVLPSGLHNAWLFRSLSRTPQSNSHSNAMKQAIEQLMRTEREEQGRGIPTQDAGQAPRSGPRQPLVASSPSSLDCSVVRLASQASITSASQIRAAACANATSPADVLPIQPSLVLSLDSTTDGAQAAKALQLLVDDGHVSQANAVVVRLKVSLWAETLLDLLNGVQWPLHVASLAIVGDEAIESLTQSAHVPASLLFTFKALARVQISARMSLTFDQMLFAPVRDTITSVTLRSNMLFNPPVGLLSDLPHLTSLDLSNNLIHVLPDHAFAALRSAPLFRLDLSSNQIARLSPLSFDGLTSLTALHLSTNALQSIPSAVLEPLPRLQELLLDTNQLCSIPEALLFSLPALEVIDLAANRLEVLPESLFARSPRLQIVDLSRNQLRSIPPSFFAGLSRVTFLDLSYNEISALRSAVFQPMPALLTCVLNDNQLRNLPVDLFSSTSNLTLLTLASNGLTALPPGVFDSVSMLATLWLFENELEALPPAIFRHLTKLSFLPMSTNRLTAIAPGTFDTTTVLEQLWLSFNALQTIPARLFQHLTSCKVLILGENAITELPMDAFAGLSMVEMLWLHGNLLSTLPPTVFNPTPSLTWLTLAENPNLHASLATLAGLSNLEILQITDSGSFDVGEGLTASGTLPALTNLQTNGTKLVGDVQGFFSLRAPSSLRQFAIGWPGLTEAILPIQLICRLLVDAGATLTISESGYAEFPGCEGKNIASLRMSNNPYLHTVTSASHEVLDVSDCPNLRSLSVGLVDIIDISNTLVGYSSTFCKLQGRVAFLGRNVQHPSFARNSEVLLRTCFANAEVFDFSRNDWLEDLQAINAAAPFRVVLGENTVEGNMRDIFADSRAEAQFRSTVPLAFFEGTAIECQIDIALADLDTSQRTVPTFTFECTCTRGHRREGNVCVSVALTSGEIAGITLGALFLLVAIASPILWRWYLRKQKEKYLILHDKEIQEKLLGDEVNALKKGWSIDLAELELLNLVDEGAFGQVWRAHWDGVDVAVKFLKYASMGLIDTMMLEDIDKEVDFLRRTRHPNLVRFFGTGVDSHNAPFLVLEFVEHGSLKKLLLEDGLDSVLPAQIKKRKHGSNGQGAEMFQGGDDGHNTVSSRRGLAQQQLRIPSSTPDLKVHLIKGIVDGMAFLHGLDVMHRDLKSGNVLVSKRLVAKITDFGSMSRKLGSSGFGSQSQHHQHANTNGDDVGTPNESRLASLAHGNETDSDFDTSAKELQYDRNSSTRTVGVTMTAGVGTPLYMAPEVLDGKTRRISPKADVFSFGVLMWEVYMCQVPDLIEQECGNDFQGFLLAALETLYRDGKRLRFPAQVPDAYTALALQCMAQEASERPSFSQIQTIVAAGNWPIS